MIRKARDGIGYKKGFIVGDTMQGIMWIYITCVGCCFLFYYFINTWTDYSLTLSLSFRGKEMPATWLGILFFCPFIHIYLVCYELMLIIRIYQDIWRNK